MMIVGYNTMQNKLPCVNSLGPRFTASIACLLGCVYNGERGKDMAEIRRCEQACNDQFGTTLYASSQNINRLENKVLMHAT